ncbi:hypothetical protein OQA88_8005 [Cercophora sp. LCS_1]
MLSPIVVVVDTVGSLSPPPLQASDPINSYLGPLEEFARSACHGYGSLDKLTDAIHRLPFPDTEVSLFRKTGRYNRRLGEEAARYFRELRGQAEAVDVVIPRVSIHASGITTNIGRQLFSTDQGKFGIGPSDLRPGDLICVFRGCEVPFIVRTTNNTTETGKWLWKKQVLHCTLVGEAYIHGIMDGEALDSGTKTEFHIR